MTALPTEPVGLTTEAPAHHGTAPSAAAPGGALVADGYDPRLTNEDLAPLRQQRWTSYNIFAFWMSDVHSVGGYVTAGSLFALGIAGWQVLVALLVGIVIVQVFANLVAKPSQQTGVPYPVINRAVFGVKGANIPAVIRGLIAVAWYGVQTYLAATSLNIIWLKFVPGAESLLDHSFLGLEALGWISFAVLWVAQAALFWRGVEAVGWVSFAVLWVAQAALFWRGMETIKKFIDFAGPAVYVVMIALAGYLVSKAGWSGIDLDLHTGPTLTGWASISAMIGAIALVVSYFSGPMLNFGDFARYGKTFAAVKRGNFLGLPVNFLFFSILTVVCASATVPVFGTLMTDPIETVQAIDTPFAVLLGGLTFVTATVGINIVANFISPAFDFSNVSPQKISWRMGGMIAAVGSVLLTPWNWYDSAEGIRFTLGILGSLIGPLFGILIAGYYLAGRQRVGVDDMSTMAPTGRYWFRGGYNPNAVVAVLAAGVPTILLTLFASVGDYGWFLDWGLGFAVFAVPG